MDAENKGGDEHHDETDDSGGATERERAMGPGAHGGSFS
jgi:hypothetical protein